jgi:cytochrome c-type biogenesis protein CcmE
MKNRRIKLAATVLIAVLGIGYVAAQSLKDVSYYKMVHEVTKDPDPWIAKKEMQLHGFVVPGSISSNVVDQQTHRSFKLEDKGEEILVRHSGTVPDTFKDQAEVVATGKLTREGGKLVLLAIDGDRGVSAKCPSKYNGDQKR